MTDQDQLKQAAEDVANSRNLVIEAALDLCRDVVMIAPSGIVQEAIGKFSSLEDLGDFLEAVQIFKDADQLWTKKSNRLLELVGGRRE